MIAEGVVQARNLDFGHVAFYAIGFGYTAGFAGVLWLRHGGVTLPAFAVVIRKIADEWFVRIMAGCAGNSRVGRIVATAVGQSIKLKSHVEDVVRALGSCFGPTRVAPSADRTQLLVVERGQLLHFARNASCHRCCVFLAMLMASSALNPGCQ